MDKHLQIISRAEAKRLGMKSFFTGAPCERGGVGERNTKTYKCRCSLCVAFRSKKQREASRRWWEKSKDTTEDYRHALSEEERKARARRYYRNKIRCPEKKRRKLEQGKQWRDNNPEKASEYRAWWNKANGDKKRAYSSNRRAALRGAQGRHSLTDVQAIQARQRNQCATCRATLSRTGYHVDHIQPLARGGTNWPSNLQLLCPACNLSKGAKDPLAWAQQNGKLL